MRDVRGWLVGIGLGAFVLVSGGCGDSADTTNDVSANTTTALASSPLRDGSYLLTGTQECKNPRGGDPISSPIFDGSTLTIAGDRATVRLTNDSLEASSTIDGDSFRVNGTHDGQWPFELTGTSTDGGQNISGTGQDAGVNCTYTFTGTWSESGGATTDPCNDMKGWASVDPAFGELRVISSCSVPWARANFANQDDTLLHWNGSTWEVGDTTAYCATVTRPPGEPLESNPAARIWVSTCSTVAQSTTTTTATTSTTVAAAAGPCTKAAVQAALPASESIISDPKCDAGWATTDVLIGPENEVLRLFRWNGSAWTLADRFGECGAGNVPASLYNLICLPTD